VKSVSEGTTHTCAIKSDDTITCWGDNRYGQLNVPAPPPDATPPVITSAVTGEEGTNGWYRSDVTVSWTVSDPESPVLGQSGCTSTTISADTSGTTLTCTATSGGGTNSRSVTIKRDTTAPTVTAAASSSTLLLNETTATATAAASDAGSGLAGPPSCPALDTGSIGIKTVTCEASDGAGWNGYGRASYTVTYKFVGFTTPVDNDGIVNQAKAGLTIPLKWRLLDAYDQPVTNLASYALTVTSATCVLGETTDQIEEYSTGASGLLNLHNGYYQVNWKTPSTYAKSCKTLSLNLFEGSTHTALFEFTK